MNKGYACKSPHYTYYFVPLLCCPNRRLHCGLYYNLVVPKQIMIGQKNEEILPALYQELHQLSIIANTILTCVHKDCTLSCTCTSEHTPYSPEGGRG